jgi:hypothetical protein
MPHIASTSGTLWEELKNAYGRAKRRKEAGL